jgi:hypothetical protein
LEKRINNKEYSPYRTLKMSGYGFFFTGALFHQYYKFLDKVFVGHSVKIVLKKTLFNQLTISPFLTGFLFFYVNTMEYANQGILKVRDETIKKIKKDYFNAYINSLKVWPLANFINFFFVPIGYRVLFVNLIGACWSIYLTFISYRDIKK